MLSNKTLVLVLGAALAVCSAAAGTWALYSHRGPEIADRPASAKPAIPFSLRHFPIEAGPAAQPALQPNSSVRYSLGDRLKITLFEKVDLSDEEQSNVPATGLVERTELTGDYIVQENGFIVLPLIGAIEAGGQPAEQVVQTLEAAFQRTMRRPAKASVVLLDREPVYIAGKGIKPGAFKYSPGMTILHALALSGAGKEDSSDLYAYAEYARSLEKQEIAIQRLKKLLAQEAALLAQQSGNPVVTPPRLIELAGAEEAKRLAGDAAAVRKLIAAARQPQIAASQAALAAARQETASQMNRIDVLDEHIKLHVDRRDKVAEIRKHNDGLAFALVQMENEVATAKEKKQEAVAALSQAQVRISQAEQNLAKLEADLKVELQNEIVTAGNEIAEQEASLKAARHILSDLRIASIRGPGKNESSTYVIVRRNSGGLSQFPATETAELIPGDLIRVNSRAAGEF
jgi:protein involved in polysaccharide export with SLBB domain